MAVPTQSRVWVGWKKVVCSL